MSVINSLRRRQEKKMMQQERIHKRDELLVICHIKAVGRTGLLDLNNEAITVSASQLVLALK